MAVVRARLEGSDAELGRVAAADVARMIFGLERAIARAAYVVLGGSRRGTGRHRQAIESASRLRFVGVEPGSVVGLLALPDAEPYDAQLPLPVPHLSQLAVEQLFDAIARDDRETDVELAGAVGQMAADLGIGDRNTALTLTGDWPSHAGAPVRAVLDFSVRERMQRLSSQLPSLRRDETLVGVLVEADFEAETARLRLPDGGAVTVRFPDDLADAIQEALRSQTQVQGYVRYHPRTSQVTDVELRAVVRGAQLALDADSFWQQETFAHLQEAQGTTGQVDPGDLAISNLTDDERTAFLAALSS